MRTRIVRTLFRLVAIPYLAYQLLKAQSSKQLLIWGVDPLINCKFWSHAMREAGWQSITLMTHHYPAHTRSDFDLYFADLVPDWLKCPSSRIELAPYFALLHILRHASVLHCSYNGGPIGRTHLRRLESWLLKRAGVKTVLIPFGSDAYMYSRVFDPSLTNGLLASYPSAARSERQITENVRYWTERADAMICGIMIDGMGRWDIPAPSVIVLDADVWKARGHYSAHDGLNGPVRVIHTPNHRGFKGTEFLLDAVDKLKQDGLNIDLILLEGVPNDRVKQMMLEADILVEQLIFTGYAMSGIEGMATGIPVISNLQSETYTRVFRRYSFLSECPIASAAPETILDVLRCLVRNPSLRRELGQAARRYVEKYHAYGMAQYMFGAIYRKILDGEEVALMDLFHPLKSEFNRRLPRVLHPLVDSEIPAESLAGSGPAVYAGVSK